MSQCKVYPRPQSTFFQPRSQGLLPFFDIGKAARKAQAGRIFDLIGYSNFYCATLRDFRRVRSKTTWRQFNKYNGRTGSKFTSIKHLNEALLRLNFITPLV